MAVHSKDIIKAYLINTLNRYGTEIEIANGILFLASNKASYITGQNLSIDVDLRQLVLAYPHSEKIRKDKIIKLYI